MLCEDERPRKAGRRSGGRPTLCCLAAVSSCGLLNITSIFPSFQSGFFSESGLACRLMRNSRPYCFFPSLLRGVHWSSGTAELADLAGSSATLLLLDSRMQIL